MRTWSSILVVLALAASAHAAPVAPSKPSQMVVLRPGAVCTGSSLAFDTRINPDGTTSAFTIPDKQVLVVDSLAWTVNDGPSPGNLCGITLRIDTTAVWAATVTASNASGNCSDATVLPNLVIPAGKTLCIGVGAGGIVNPNVTRIHGFLTKAK